MMRRVIAANDSDTSGNRLGGQTVVTGDHDDLDARRVALLHGYRDLVSRRVHHRHEPDEDKIALRLRWRVVDLLFRNWPIRHREHPEPAAGEIVVLSHNLGSHLVGQRLLAVQSLGSRT